VAAALRGLMRATLRRTFRHDLPVIVQRRRLESVVRLIVLPRDVDFVPGECGRVRGEWVRCRKPSRPDAAILYLHGGAYCLGSPRTHRAITGALARLTGAKVFVADYRLAPEHPFPAALDDATNAYGGLLDTGHDPRHVAVAGDSAGGGLALATALHLRASRRSLPAALVTFSPWVDLRDVDRGPVPAGEVMLSPRWIEACARHYLGSHDAGDPLASPVLGDLSGLPATLIQVGTDEVLLPDSRRVHEALERAGVTACLEVYPDRWHVFQSGAGMLADADRALASAARFVRERWR
jgi:acetyl esterase/lipase